MARKRILRHKLILVSILNFATFLAFVFAMGFYEWVWVELDFIDLVFSNIKERNISVVPTSPEIAKFVRRNRKYKRMLPVGIRI